MVTHFQWKPLHQKLPGWKISFFYKGVYFEAIYKQDGSLEWLSHSPSPSELPSLTKAIHELMLFHVYDN